MKNSSDAHRHGCERFLALLNANEINQNLIDSLEEGLEEALESDIDFRHESSEFELGKLKEKLLGWAITISKDLDWDAAMALIDWASNEWAAEYTVSGDYYVVLEDSTVLPVSSLRAALAAEILETFAKVNLKYFRRCIGCQKFFLARYKNKRYCQASCDNEQDRKENQKKYNKLLQLRRIGSKYIPVSFFACEKCHKPVRRRKGIENLERVRCPNCGTRIINHFHWKKK